MPSTPGAPVLPSGLAPRKRVEPAASMAFRREQFEQFAVRVPPFQIAGSIFMPALGVWDFAFGHRAVVAGPRLYSAIVCGATTALFLGSYVALRRLRDTPHATRVAAAFFVGVEILLSFYLVARVSVVGGAYGWLLASTSLIIAQLVRTVVMPLSWKQSLAACLIWAAFPIGWAAHWLAFGVWPPAPTEHADLVRASVFPLLVISSTFSVIGSHILFGLRRQTFEASQAARYQIDRRLGGGAMGDVYLAQHGTLRAECAIKVCRVPPGADPAMVAQRFEREAQQVARLEHPHIVRVFDYGEMEDGSLYFAMEYLRGMDLDAFLQRHGPVPEDRLLYWIDAALRALGHAHARGVVHRDLKPGNLILADLGGEPDFVKVLDFGLAKVLTLTDGKAITQAGDMAGTPWYMSPEQARGETTLDHRTDLYAAGAMIFHLASGRHVFDAPTAIAAVVRHLSDPAPPLRSIAPEASKELEATVARLLAKDPKDRFPDAGAVRTALRASPHWGGWTRERALAWWAERPMPRPSRELEHAHTLPASGS